MLSMLVKYRKSGIENVCLVERVEYYPPQHGKENNPEPGLLVEYSNGKAVHLPLTPIGDEDYRDVFVMNEKAATVARYTL